MKRLTSDHAVSREGYFMKMVEHGEFVPYADAQRLEEQLEAAVRLAVAELEWHDRRSDKESLLKERDAARADCIRLGLGAKLKLEG